MRFPSGSFFTLALLCLVVVLLVDASFLGRLAGLVPLWVAWPTLALLAFELVLECFPGLAQMLTPYGRLRLKRTDALMQRSDRELSMAQKQSTPRELPVLLWTLVLPAAVLTTGFVVGGSLFVTASLGLRAAVPWRKAVLSGCATGAFLFLISGLLHNPLYPGWFW